MPRASTRNLTVEIGPTRDDLVRQYTQLKGRFADTIFLFHDRDFYLAIDQDAPIVGRVCGIYEREWDSPTATKTKMLIAAVPYHAITERTEQLVAAGYKVAVCEQVESPDAPTREDER